MFNNAIPAPTPAAGPQSATPAASAPAAALYARIPAEVGTFKLTERTLVEGTTGDSAYRYSDGSRTRVTVFVYDVEKEDMVEGGPEAWTAREGEQFKEVQDIQVARGKIAAYEKAYSGAGRISVVIAP